jgi:hypothetical protein
MKRIWPSRPSPALVVAVVALVAALAGTAVAADPLVTSSAEPVTKQKVKRIAKKIAKRQARKKVNAFEAAKFPIGASDLAAIDEHSESENLPPGSAAGVFTDETATANCDSDEQVISGGWSTEFEDNGTTKLAFVVSDKRSDNGWEASAVNLSSTETNELTVYAYCLAP